MNNNHTGEYNEVDRTFDCCNDLTMVEKRKLLLTLKQENNQLKRKLNILDKAIYVIKDNELQTPNNLATPFLKNNNDVIEQ